jgi:hygromycin-B 7''-O-kinase
MRDDLAHWAPYVERVLDRHGLRDAGEPVAGYNPTHPTFVCGDVVVKLFGDAPWWRTGFPAERAALAAVAGDPAIGAPRVLAEGTLSDDPDAPEPYLVLSRVPGASVEDAVLTGDEWTALATQAGRLVARLHALPPDDAVTEAAWTPVGVEEAARRSSLPPHLAAQAAAYVARRPPDEDPVLCHGDLCRMHLFRDGGAVSGVIDWGDAMVTDRHYELVQVFRDLLGCDRALLRTFLDASDWPAAPDFPHRALAHAIRRQAYGLAQHYTIDVFMPVAAAFPLTDIATLDELATVLFDV